MGKGLEELRLFWYKYLFCYNTERMTSATISFDDRTWGFIANAQNRSALVRKAVDFFFTHSGAIDDGDWTEQEKIILKQELAEIDSGNYETVSAAELNEDTKKFLRTQLKKIEAGDLTDYVSYEEAFDRVA